MESKGRNVDVVANWDLKEYASRYRGGSKIRRLLEIAQRCSGVQREAYSLLISSLKEESYNTALYQEVCIYARSAGVDTTECEVDRAWIEKINSHVLTRRAEIDQNLQLAKTSMRKDDIRRCHMEKGALFHKVGEYQEAAKCYARALEYTSTQAHKLESNMAIFTASIDIGNFQQASQYISRIDTSLANTTKNKCRAAFGILSLAEGDFKSAARNFLDCDGSLIGAFKEVVSAEDVALYGTLCAAASSSFTEVHRSVVQNKTFRPLLETVPELRSLMQRYSPSKCGEFLQWIDRRRGELSLDPYLGKHVTKLVDSITDRILVQYFKPYRTLRIGDVAEQLGMPMLEMEAKFASLITAKKIGARIDSQEHTLHANIENEREQAIQKVSDIAAKHATKVRQAILRLSLVKHQFCVEPSADSGESANSGGDLMDDDDDM